MPWADKLAIASPEDFQAMVAAVGQQNVQNVFNMLTDLPPSDIDTAWEMATKIALNPAGK